MIAERIVEIDDKGLYVADKEYIVRCEYCVHCHENVWAEDIGLNDWAGLIVGHWACDFWGKEWCQTKPDGFVIMGIGEKMSNLEHYFENLLYYGKDVYNGLNKQSLTPDVRDAVEVCAQYVIYSLFGNRKAFEKFISDRRDND